MKPLEPWPELGEFIRELVRAEVDAAIQTAIDSLMQEIAFAAEPKKPRTRSTEDWLTAKRAARIAGVKPSTILTWSRIGRLARYGTQRRVLVSRADLDRLLAEGGHRTLNGHAS